MENIELTNKINRILTYLMCILFCLRLTKIYNYELFQNLLLFVIGISFVLIIFNYKKFNKEWLVNNYLMLTYILIRTLSIFINKGMILNLKTFIYEIFFIIIVSQLLKREKKDVIYIGKIVILINFILNIISIIYQYLLEATFNKELFGVYTNPNALASFTVLSLIMYITFFYEENKQIFRYIYILFSIIIIILSQARTSIICLSIYIVIKILLRKKITLNAIKNIFGFSLIGILVVIIAISYINSGNIYPSDIETKINDITTNRYYLWKYSVISLNKNPLLGIGEQNIGEYRREVINKEVIETIAIASRINLLSLNNNHNGYLQLLVGNGYVCFIFFMIYLLKNVKKMEEERFLIVSQILIINLFENQLILTQSLFSFLLMYLLLQKEDIKLEKNNLKE